MVTKHTKPSAENPEGGITKMESSIKISNLMVVDSATGEATKIGRKLDENGKLQRISKKTGEVI
jgi:large subunit ribosomal protein L24